MFRVCFFGLLDTRNRFVFFTDNSSDLIIYLIRELGDLIKIALAKLASTAPSNIK